MVGNIFFERLCLWYRPSLQGTACSKLATETQGQGVKAVQE